MYNITTMFNTKKKYFKQKLNGVQKMIWDYEFKLSKTRMIRELERKEYDNLMAKLDALERQIKSQKENSTLEEGEIKRLEDNKVILERDIQRKKDILGALDTEIQGSKPTNENQEGVQGIMQYIDGLQELKQMIKEYIKTL